MEFFFHGHWRMDWGLGNPNKTAVLIAMLMVGAWFPTFFKRAFSFWTALLLNFVLGICLIQTYSRGGLISAAAGLLVLIPFFPCPWPRKKVLMISTVEALLFVFALFRGATSRYEQSLVSDDASIQNRLEMWGAAPVMMMNAPGGWGLGKSGWAYVQWYQTLGKSENYRTLVNSHLTWLVEFPWWGRMAYLAVWGSVIFLCWPSEKHRFFCIPLGVWTAFGVGAFFSSVAESPWLWLVPGISFFVVFITRWASHDWPCVRSLGWVIGWVLVMVAFIWALGSTKEEIEIRKEPGLVTVGPSPYSTDNGRKITLVAPDPKILGEHYGHAIRMATLEKGWRITILDDFMPNRGGGDTFIFMGDGVRGLPSGPLTIKILNPQGKPPVSVSAPTGSITIYWGEFFQTEFRAQWEAWARAHGFAFQQVAGAGEYLVDWTALLDK